MKNKRKVIIITSVCVLIVATGLLLWNIFASPTRIAFVNYQAISLGLISKANDNSFVTIKELPVEELDHASDYDMVFVNGMGLRITDEQRQSLATAADKGTPVLTTAATNPQNLIVSVQIFMLRLTMDFAGRVSVSAPFEYFTLSNCLRVTFSAEPKSL